MSSSSSKSTSATDSEADIASLTFEDAMAHLESLVRTLEEGEAKLEETIQLYERGIALKAHCEVILKTAQARIEKITLDAQGMPVGTEPLGEMG